MPRFFWILPLTPRDLLRAALTSLVLALAFCLVLGRYYRFYHLGTPWTGVGLLMFVLPAALVGGTVVSLMVAVLLRGRRAPATAASWGGLALFFVLLLALFGAELARTRTARSGEGEHAGDLAPFFRSLVGGN